MHARMRTKTAKTMLPIVTPTMRPALAFLGYSFSSSGSSPGTSG